MPRRGARNGSERQRRAMLRAGSPGRSPRLGMVWQRTRWGVTAVGYEFEATLWRWDARQSQTWAFVSLPQELADEILEAAGPAARGFGSLRVEVTVGSSV